MKEILIVCATRRSPEYFRKQAPLAASLKKLQTSSKVVSHITYRNRRGLGSIYNRYLSVDYSKRIVVFVHDDVCVEDLFFVEKLNAAITMFDVIGLAGNQQPAMNHPSWFDQRRPLSGAVAHPLPTQSLQERRHIFVSSYGPSPADCQLLDGCFLAVNTKKIVSAGARFDEQFRFHFYDLDFCRTCSVAGLRLGTWPLWVVHESPGSFRSREWKRASQLYGRKWVSQAGSLPIR